jgi:hypothetical protein
MCVLQIARKHISREEVELQDVERQMEEELVEQYMNVERVIAVRSEPDGSLRYLCKARHDAALSISPCPFTFNVPSSSSKCRSRCCRHHCT